MKNLRVVSHIVLLCLGNALYPAHGQEAGIVIHEGASLITGGNSSIIINNGSFTNNGTFHASDDNSFIMAGASVQSITGKGAILFSNLTVNNTAGVNLGSAVDVSRVLLCNGVLNSNGYLRLLSSETGTALVDGSGIGSVNGTVTMQRYITNRLGYTYISSPFQSSLVEDLIDESFFSVYSYDENKYVAGVPVSGWVEYGSPSNVLNPLVGYAVHLGFEECETVIDLTGVVNNGEISLPVYNHGHPYTNGFNLCGNPYPSPVDWHKVWQLSTNLDDAIYVFRNSDTDPFGGIYDTFVNGISSDGSVSNIIPSMQGFFVHVSDGPLPVTGNLRMNNSVRVTGQSQSPPPSGSKSSKPLIRLSSSFMNIGGSTDFTVIYFDDKATEEFDGSLDALKLLNTDFQTPNLFSVTPGGRQLSINALPGYPDMPSIVQLGLKIEVEGIVAFGVSQMPEELASYDFYFHDKVTGTSLRLTPGMDYKVNLPAGEYLNRFCINLTGEPTNISNPAVDQEGFKAWFSGDVLNLQIYHIDGGSGSLRLFNLSGKQMLVKRIEEPGTYELNPALTDGIYILTMDSGRFRSSRKIIKTGR